MPSPSPVEQQVPPAGQVSRATLISVSEQGPIPAPHVLETYEQVVPGLAARIVDWTEAEQRHRHELERRALDGKLEAQRLSHSERRRSQFLALFLSIAFLAAGVFLTLSEHSAVGGVIFGTTILAIPAIAYLNKRRPEESENR